MNEQKLFIGRTQEFKMIEQMLEDPTGASHLLPIVGEAGVGKTWLLRESARRYEEHQSVQVIKIDYREVRGPNWQPLTPKVPLSQQKRILILADTTETIPESRARLLHEMLSKLPNSVMVMAAHPLKQQQLASLQTIYQGWVVHVRHELMPFSFNEINCYFKTFLRGRVPRQMRQQMTLLIGHKPVLIALLGEWLKRHTDFPPDIDSSLKEWSTLNKWERARCRQRFEFELVERWHFLRRLIDWSILFFAYLNRRYDPQILKLTLELSDAEVKMVTEEISNDLFIRKSISTESGLLHDEMQRLLMEQAWPVLGSLGELERMLARQVIDGYYLPKIEELKGMEEDFLRRELQRECLDYHFRISEEVGLSYLDQLLTEAENYHHSAQQLEAISQEISQLGLEKLSQMTVRMARLAQQKKEFKQAVCLAQAVLSRSPASAEAAQALILLAKNSKEAKDKYTYLQNALQKAQLERKRELEAQAHHQLGLLLQKQGKWPEAAQRYQKALHLLEEEKQPNEYAKSLNQLALVTMQSGNPMLALQMSEKALRIYKEQDNLYGKRICLATKVRISQPHNPLAQRHVHNGTDQIMPSRASVHVENGAEKLTSAFGRDQAITNRVTHSRKEKQ